MVNGTVIGGAPQPPPLRVTGEQLGAVVLFDVQIAQLEIAAQACLHLGQKEAVAIFIAAKEHIVKQADQLKRKWSTQVLIAQPGDVPKLVGS